ncbi:hypothetical protein LZ30DRAFT_740859 [Colletotrichum cereale]|nr:hypothetical protein LZ30DRAFT_740859 [Colletotrichum cereale]
MLLDLKSPGKPRAGTDYSGSQVKIPISSMLNDTNWIRGGDGLAEVQGCGGCGAVRKVGCLN